MDTLKNHCRRLWAAYEAWLQRWGLAELTHCRCVPDRAVLRDCDDPSTAQTQENP